jgi:hypothetical protein
MSLRERYTVDPLDSYIQWCLKNWVAHQSPPAELRARLMQTTLASEKEEEDRRDFPPLVIGKILRTISGSFLRELGWSVDSMLVNECHVMDGLFDISRLRERQTAIQSLPIGTSLFYIM